MKIFQLSNSGRFEAPLIFQNLFYEVNLTVGNFTFWLKNIFSGWTFTICSQMLWGTFFNLLFSDRITVRHEVSVTRGMQLPPTVSP